jgi:hypothetical protein
MVNVSRLAVLMGASVLSISLCGAASAQVVCSQLTPTQLAQDEDRDGFTNQQECNGITLDTALATGAPAWGASFAGRYFPPVSATGCAASECVDPNKKDVFVLTVPLASGGVIDTLPSATFLNRLRNAGLNVHELRSANAADFPSNRQVTASSPQPAVKIVESTDVSGVDLGFCYKGPPTVSGVAFVYVNRIRNRVNAQCLTTDKCVIAGQTGTATPAAIVSAVTEWVANHESLHCLDITAKLDPATGSYHLPTVTTDPPTEQSTYIQKVRKADELYTIPGRIDPSTPPSVHPN